MPDRLPLSSSSERQLWIHSRRASAGSPSSEDAVDPKQAFSHGGSSRTTQGSRRITRSTLSLGPQIGYDLNNVKAIHKAQQSKCSAEHKG
jgi:hypothetical protein